jgi:hypothetical protein
MKGGSGKDSEARCLSDVDRMSEAQTRQQDREQG